MSCRTITPSGATRQIVVTTSETSLVVSETASPVVVVDGAAPVITVQCETPAVVISETPVPVLSTQNVRRTIAAATPDIPAFTVVNPGVQIAVAATTSKVIVAANTIRTFTTDPCATTPTMFTISGKIIWEGNRLTTQSGVAGVVVTLSGTESQTMTTDIDGLYSFTVAGTGSYNISCAKNSVANALNGVAASDANRVNQHVLGILPLVDPYKLIAADVNGSNSVSSADASQINQAVIGNPISKAAFALKTWVMVPQAYSFPNSLSPWGYSTVIALNDVSTAQTNQNFIGIKLGDVNANANPAI